MTNSSPSAAQPFSVAVIIVNWNTGPLLAQCLESLASPQNGAGLVSQVVVVDNGSTDLSAKNLDPDSFPWSLSLIENQDNSGFAAACNQGADQVTHEGVDLLLFLNPDTRLEPGALEQASSFLNQNPKVGICGVRLVDENGITNTSAARFPSPGLFLGDALGFSKLGLAQPHLLLAQQLNQDRQVDQVIGAFFLTRRSLFVDLGGFDARFFVYFEEVDYSFRALKAGFSSWFLAEPTVFHVGGGSTKQVKARRLFYSLRSRLLYGRKHFSLMGILWLYFTTLWIEPWPRIIAALVGLSSASLGQTLKGFLLLWSWLLTGGPKK